jgi:hypothetical protein
MIALDNLNCLDTRILCSRLSLCMPPATRARLISLMSDTQSKTQELITQYDQTICDNCQAFLSLPVTDPMISSWVLLRTRMLIVQNRDIGMESPNISVIIQLKRPSSHLYGLVVLFVMRYI